MPFNAQKNRYAALTRSRTLNVFRKNVVDGRIAGLKDPEAVLSMRNSLVMTLMRLLIYGWMRKLGLDVAECVAT